MSSCILVENLNPRTDVSKLCEMFGKFGRILSANIETDNNLTSLCRGYISYDTIHSAHYAVKEMNGKTVYVKHVVTNDSTADSTQTLHNCAVKKRNNGRTVHLQHEVTNDSAAGSTLSQHNRAVKEIHAKINRTDSVKPGTTNNQTSESTQAQFYNKIFVKNIDSDWDEYYIVGSFERFGEIEEVKISRTDGKSNGYAFVKFETHSSAKTAVEAMHDKVIGDKKLTVQPFVLKDQNKNTDSPDVVHDKNIQANNLFVKNLPEDMDNDELKELFKKFGAIQSVRVATDNAQKSKGYGFVCFYDQIDAAKACSQMHGIKYRSKNLKVDYYRKKSNSEHTDSKTEEREKNILLYPYYKKTLFSFSAKG